MCRSCARAHVDILYLTNGGKTKKTNKQKKKTRRELHLWFCSVSTLCTTNTVMYKSCLNAFSCCDLYSRILWKHLVYNFNTYFKCIVSYVVCLPFRRDIFLKVFWLEYR